MPKSKKTLALLKVLAWLRGLVPEAGLAKLKVRVCQVLAWVVVVALVSTVLVGSVESSSLRRTMVPASGDHTRMVAVWEEGVMSSPAGRLRKVVPAQVSAPTTLTTCATAPEAPEGGVCAMDEPAPPKSLSGWPSGRPRV